jgi:hypothetical protein
MSSIRKKKNKKKRKTQRVGKVHISSSNFHLIENVIPQLLMGIMSSRTTLKVSMFPKTRKRIKITYKLKRKGKKKFRLKKGKFLFLFLEKHFFF